MNQEYKEKRENDLKYFMEVLYSTQDQEKIIYNILNGRKYLTLSISELIVDSLIIEKGKIINSRIPDFEEHTIYIPYVEKATFKDYVNKYKELSELDIQYIENEKIVLNLSETVNNFKEKEQEIKESNTHELKFRKNEDREEHIKKYYLIYNFLKENYPNKEKTNYAFYLDFNFELIEINNSQLYQLDRLSFIFYVKNRTENLRNLPLLKNLLIQEVENELFLGYDLDLEKSIEFIENFNEIKNF